MENILENYREVFVNVIGTIAAFVMLSFSFTAYTAVINSLLNAVFYK